MLRLFLLFAFIIFGNCNNVPTPLSIANPYHLLAQELPRHSVSLQRSYRKDFKLDPLDLIINSNNSTANFSDPCAKSILQFGKDLIRGENYAIQMLDAWGKPESGIKEGNLRWGGRYYECLNSQSQHFKPKYCTTYIGGSSNPASFGLSVQPGITLAGCYPDTCSGDNVSSLFYPLAKKFNISVVATDCPESEVVWEAKDIIGLIVLIHLVCVVISSTLYEYLHTRKKNEKYNQLYDDLNSTQHPPYDRNNGTKFKVLTSFSIISNTKKLLSTEQRPSDIHCLHGMRFISMCWVLLGHSFLFPASFSNNLLFMARYYVTHGEFQAVGNATFSVDSFFFLSGLLVTYLGLRQLKRRNGAMNVPLMYLFRYLRLTPPYALLIFLSVSLYPKLGSGPMWGGITGQLSLACSKYWYSNLLYFNNLYPAAMGDECYAWGWYLANDTQFYILAPLFLYLLYRYRAVGLAVTSSVALVSVIITGVFSSITNQQPQASGIGFVAKSVLKPPVATNSSLPLNAEPQQYSLYVSDLYTKPWCRIGAYLVGMLTGYVLYSYNNKIRMPKVVAVLGWVGFGTTACALLYGLYPSFSDINAPVYDSILDNNTAAFYNAISRPLWAVCLAWVTIACTNGYGGPINTFLSWKAFMPLSRLTYCTYLVHPLVIWWLVGTSETLFHYSIQLMIMIFAGALTLSSLLAYFVSMIIEFPVANLMKILQSRDDRPVPKSIDATNDGDVAPLVA